MKVLVTGSSGYLASLVLPRLAAMPGVDELVGLDRVPPRVPVPGLRHVELSVLDPRLPELFARERPDLVLHLAWVFNPTHDREAMRRVDVDGTDCVLRAAAGAGVDHLIHLSSATSYGAHASNPERLRETDPPQGNDDFPYAADKAAVERLIDRFEREHPSLGITRARPCIVLGGRTDNFVRAILDLPVLLRIRGHDPELQFLHESDLADCLVLMVERRPRGPFNIAPTGTVRFSELGELLGRPMIALPDALVSGLVTIGWALRLFAAPPGYLHFVRWPWIVDVARARTELSFSTRYSSRDAVRAMRTARDRGRH